MDKGRFLFPPLMRNALKLSASTVLMYGLVFVVTPILSRLYQPELFGEWGVFAGVVSIVSFILCLCYDQALVGEKDERNVFPIMVLCLLSALAVCIVTCGVMLFGAWMGWRFFTGFPSLSLLAAFLLLHALNMLFLAFANWCEAYGKMSVNNLLIGVTQALFRLLLGGRWAKWIKGNGLIIGTVLSQGVATCFMLWAIRKRLKEVCLRDYCGWNQLKVLALRYRKYPLYDAPSMLLAMSASNVSLLLLSVYYSKSEIGCYSVVLQLLLLPMTFVGSAIGKTYFRDISKCDKPEQMKSVTMFVLRVMAVLSLLPILFLTFGGDFVVAWFLGDRWMLAGRLALCLSLWTWSFTLVQPLLPLYRKLGLQQIMLRFDILHFGAALLAIGFGIIRHYTIEEVALLYAVCVSVVKLWLLRDILKRACIKRQEIPLWYWCVSLLIVCCWLIRLVGIRCGTFPC
ncbi:MAG: lipopolysaccharide biosynthesis protein [Paraprevotella sp.]|nr:lipopolysaccharide biosynthesis protein [Paraprevotella sp.]